MAYMIPLRYVLLSKKRNRDDKRYDFAVCATRIVGLMSMDAFQARESVKRERQAGTLINAAGREKVETCVFLDNGSVVASPLTVKQIMKQIEAANAKEISPKTTYQTRTMRIYETVNEPPRTDDIDFADFSTDLPLEGEDDIDELDET